MRKTLKQELDEVKEERAQYKDNYLRALAELDNYRKRVQKEKEELVKSTTERLITQFLVVVDDFERGLECIKNPNSDEVKVFYSGVELIYKNFKSLLEQNGVESFSGFGADFDPNLHEAVAVEQTDEHPPNRVIAELSKGYKLNGKVIRPAKVVVSAKPNKSED